MAKKKKTEVMEWLDSVMADPETARAVENAWPR